MPARQEAPQFDTAFRVFIPSSLVAVALLGPFPWSIPLPVQLSLLLASVVLLGLPHGALDGVLLRNSRYWPQRNGPASFLLGYVLLAALVVILWWQFPVPALALFLAISAVHFSGDFQPAPVWARLPGGALIILLPIAFHPDEVAGLFAAISGPQAMSLAEMLALPPAFMALLLAAAFIPARGRRTATAVELLVLATLAWVAPPLVYFAIYFCCLHSLRHFQRSWHKTPTASRPRLWKEAAIYTLLSILGGVAAGIWLFQRASVEVVVLEVVFIGLAALTVPHMLIIALAGPRPERPSPQAHSPARIC